MNEKKTKQNPNKVIEAHKRFFKNLSEIEIIKQR